MRNIETIKSDIVEIFSDLLGIDKIDYDDNFFDLEINSLLATQLLYRVTQEFDTTISLKELFSAPTINELAQLVVDKEGEQGATPGDGVNDAANSQPVSTNADQIVDQLSDGEVSELLKKLGES